MIHSIMISFAITELRISKNISEHKMSLDLDKNGLYIRGITSELALPSLKSRKKNKRKKKRKRRTSVKAKSHGLHSPKGADRGCFFAFRFRCFQPWANFYSTVL